MNNLSVIIVMIVGIVLVGCTSVDHCQGGFTTNVVEFARQEAKVRFNGNRICSTEYYPDGTPKQIALYDALDESGVERQIFECVVYGFEGEVISRWGTNILTEYDAEGESMVRRLYGECVSLKYPYTHFRFRSPEYSEDSCLAYYVDSDGALTVCMWVRDGCTWDKIILKGAIEGDVIRERYRRQFGDLVRDANLSILDGCVRLGFELGEGARSFEVLPLREKNKSFCELGR